ncbi:DUF6912 family protein [Cellulomonas soli]
MRIYLPATLDELDSLTLLAPRRAHAVTPALRAALPDEDEEGLEFAAQLAAADESLLRVAGAPSAPTLRLVVSADVPEALVDAVDEDTDEAQDEALSAPSAVALRGDLERRWVVCVHVDEPAASADVQAALEGDEEAVERLAERDLLWYDVSELAAIPR